MPAIDVTDANFQTEVIEKSMTTPVVVELWTSRSEACVAMSPILERVVAETGGKVVHARVDVDASPAIAQAFQVQSVPVVVALDGGRPVDALQGAQDEQALRDFIGRIGPSQEQQQVTELVAAGDEGSLRLAIQLDPRNEAAIVALAELLVNRGDNEEALQLLERIPETEATRFVAARARVGDAPLDEHDQQLNELLEKVKDDEEARQQYVDILELMGPGDPRTAMYRKKLSARLF